MREFKDLSKLYLNYINKENGLITTGNYSIGFSSFSNDQLHKLIKENQFTPWMYKGVVVEYPYLTLFHKDGFTMMSDVPMEKETNQDFINTANGHVLIGGLGLGLIILPLLECEDIKSITVVESDLGVIDIVSPILSNMDHNKKLKIIHGDVFNAHVFFKESQFDCIYFDIWPTIVADNFLEMEGLESLYVKCLNIYNDKSTIDSWCYDYCKKLYVKTMEFREFLMREFPGKQIEIRKKRIYIDGELYSDIIVDEAYLNSKHRYSL
jgi:hypothetical protein